MKDRVYCSFCGKGNNEAEVMLAGAVAAYICETCVADAVVQIERIRSDRRETEALNREAMRCTFCTPEPLQFAEARP